MWKKHPAKDERRKTRLITIKENKVVNKSLSKQKALGPSEYHLSPLQRTESQRLSKPSRKWVWFGSWVRAKMEVVSDDGLRTNAVSKLSWGITWQETESIWEN